jgi:hypothetical protein
MTMNRRLLIVLVALALRADVSLAQNLVINIEGPWIYHVDSQFKDESGNSESVLIAMSPAVDKHVASFSTGDGFQILQPGVYCVGFDSLCAPAHSGSKSSLPGKLLRVKAPGGWNWYSNLNNTMIYLILPLPDDYANDGVYRMKFGSKFGTFGLEEKHSIGLSLRYANGPSTINLSSNCSAPSVPSCPFDGVFPDQDNSGTLRITLKAPDDPTDDCDNHVRLAYHNMLKAIDSKSLQLGINVNKDHGYIDLPKYDAGCYGKDPQNDGGLEAHVAEMPEPPPIRDVAAQLNKIVSDLGNKDLLQYHLFREELTQEAADLKIGKEDQGRGRVPSYSQLTHIQFLLARSMAAIDDVSKKDHKDRSALDTARTDEKALNDYIAGIRSALSGKDCRVAQMLIP